MSPQFRERSDDLRDVMRYLLRALQGVAHHELSELATEVVIVTHDLTPSEAVRLGRQQVVAFAIETGGLTSHTSIIARDLNIPMVAGVEGVTASVTDNDPVIIDGIDGKVVLHPSKADYQEGPAADRRAREPRTGVVEHPGAAVCDPRRGRDRADGQHRSARGDRRRQELRRGWSRSLPQRVPLHRGLTRAAQRGGPPPPLPAADRRDPPPPGLYPDLRPGRAKAGAGCHGHAGGQPGPGSQGNPADAGETADLQDPAARPAAGGRGPPTARHAADGERPRRDLRLS